MPDGGSSGLGDKVCAACGASSMISISLTYACARPCLLWQLATYVALETSWWVALYGICYRFQPTVGLMRTEWGSIAVRRVGGWLKQAWPARYDGIVKAADRVYTSPNGRTFGEWLLVNKVLAPVSFPMKLALANRIVNQRVALASAAGAALVAAEAAHSPEPDLDAGTAPLQNLIVRGLTKQMAQPSLVGVAPPRADPDR